MKNTIINTAADNLSLFERGNRTLVKSGNDVERNNVFYYEKSTNTINFGFENNLTANSSGNPRQVLNNALGDTTAGRNVVITDAMWGYIRNPTASTNPAGFQGDELAGKLNAALPGSDTASWNQKALQVTSDFLTGVTLPRVQQFIPNFNTLPTGMQNSILSAAYAGIGLRPNENGRLPIVGPRAIAAANAGDAVAFARELAFGTTRPTAADASGQQLR